MKMVALIITIVVSLLGGWIIGSMPTDNIEFSMSICDENMSELVKTDILTIDIERNEE